MGDQADLCCHHLRGLCRFAHCKFSHDTDRYYVDGESCRFGAGCSDHHATKRNLYMRRRAVRAANLRARDESDDEQLQEAEQQRDAAVRNAAAWQQRAARDREALKLARQDAEEARAAAERTHADTQHQLAGSQRALGEARQAAERNAAAARDQAARDRQARAELERVLTAAREAAERTAAAAERTAAAAREEAVREREAREAAEAALAEARDNTARGAAELRQLADRLAGAGAAATPTRDTAAAAAREQVARQAVDVEMPECPVCLTELPANAFVFGCGVHRVCEGCARQFGQGACLCPICRAASNRPRHDPAFSELLAMLHAARAALLTD